MSAINLLSKSERYFVLTFIGRRILDQRHMFLFRRVINSFSGYAGQQLRWLDYAAKHTSLPEMPDLAAIEVFQMEVNERVVRSEI